MFVVVYRWRCLPEHEAAFRLVWDVAAGDHLVEDIALGLQVARRR